jgi:hypothetical protein
MFVHVILVHMVEMAVVKIIHVAVMPNCRMPAIRAMLMRVVGVVLLRACGHWRDSLHSDSSMPINAADGGIVAKPRHRPRKSFDDHGTLLTAVDPYIVLQCNGNKYSTEADCNV